MLRKFAVYALISLSSFSVFTGIFHAVAHAQTTPLPQQPVKKALITPLSGNNNQLPTNPQTPPTPTTQTITPTTQPSISPISTPAPEHASTPLPSPTITLKTTTTPTPSLPKVSPTTLPSPTPTAAPVNSGKNADKLFSLVNTYRQSKGLAALQKDERTCSLAAARASEIAAEMANGTLHSGMYARNLPYWNTENAAAYGSEEADLQWWINDGIHRQAIESPTHTTSCVACSGNYCVQEFTSYQPK